MKAAVGTVLDVRGIKKDSAVLFEDGEIYGVIRDVNMPMAEPEEGIRFFKRWEGKGLVTPTLAPHATDTVSRELLGEVRDFSERRNALVHIHISQSRGEVLRVKKREGLLPVEYLKSTGLLNERLIGVHGVYLTDREVSLYSKSGATLVHCPSQSWKVKWLQ